MDPYRSRARIEHVPKVPLHPAWRRYHRQTFAYNVLLWASVLFLAGLVVFDPSASVLALPLLPLPLSAVWLGIRSCECPECGEPIVEGPLVTSYARYFAGLFPTRCTQCWAEIPAGPTQPDCACERCSRNA